jgi:transcriptional regulator with XRE-family HTH domain
MARRKDQPANYIGPEVRKKRVLLGLSQEEMAARCQALGYDISRGTLSQIEAQLRCVKDGELFLLANILGVTPNDLAPAWKILQSSYRSNRRRPRAKTTQLA